MSGPGVSRYRAFAGKHRAGRAQPYVRGVWFTPAPVGISLPGRPLSQRFLTPP